MFDHILVPTDFSEDSKKAFDIALNIARLEGGKITLLHVIEIIAHTTFEEFESFYAKLEKHANKSMDEWMARNKKGDILVEKKILYGSRVREIVRFSGENQVSLIILNSHKVDVENPGRGWGTISYQVGLLSDCPVMLVK